MTLSTPQIHKINNYKWLIPKSENMNVPGIIYISENMLPNLIHENVIPQIINVAKLPGIIKYSLAMPDVHQGYGAPIGGVGAFDIENGLIIPGFVGYDINCGVRLLKTNFLKKDIEKNLEKIITAIYTNIPAGVGSSGKLFLNKKEMEKVVISGAKWAVDNGYGFQTDLENTEENGKMEGAQPDKIGDHAYKRAADQIGTLGSGNHFLEIQEIKEIYDEKTAGVFGLFAGQITIMIHSGSRGLGHQICQDYLMKFYKSISKYNINLPDRQLVGLPINSHDGKDYFSAMTAGANFAWANRQIMSHRVRESFSQVLNTSIEKLEKLEITTLYDIAHNIAKKEFHNIDGKKTEVLIHRKGATRAFPKEHPEIPEKYRNAGQPVIIPGTMGTSSYVLVGTQTAMEETWGSTCHGAGRKMSRHQAVRENKQRNIIKELAEHNIIAKAGSRIGLIEEIPEAYKDIDEVIRIVENAGLSKKIAKMVPLAVIKG
ncbi:MAG: RtcB family protein [Candidatus Omnitrophica bacterium]|jgi:tRNA-splicing ligase RtcB|nr:RtcB family protein [Candidatus Omnitrophota bacterium]